MGIELTYDNFVSLTFGFFMAIATVRLRQGIGIGLESLRRWHRRRSANLRPVSATQLS